MYHTDTNCITIMLAEISVVDIIYYGDQQMFTHCQWKQTAF